VLKKCKKCRELHRLTLSVPGTRPAGAMMYFYGKLLSLGLKGLRGKKEFKNYLLQRLNFFIRTR